MEHVEDVSSEGKEDRVIEKFKIDDVARECQLTKRTVRYYEEIGLISPPERSRGGARLYTRMHINKLKEITNARDVLGFSLQEIQNFLSFRENLRDHHQLLISANDYEQKIKQLVELKGIMDKKLELIEHRLEKIEQYRQEMSSIKKRVQGEIDRLLCAANKQSGTE
ncbi:MerR family transcriptional regulator [Paenibacillus protaetiae]|uniref:MerR family transcriptional regulator n=1 Tax=Paenibacillus protaetiae TaxID=2509456 RepID=UPI0013EDF22D|nr:MerR family transcriptional regulator [Paenibacillus protaetiae]